MSVSEEIRIDPRVFKVLGYIAIGLVVVGVYMGLNAAYFEPGQWIYFAICIIGVGFASARVVFERNDLMFIGALLIVFSLAMSWTKFDWRKDYIENSKSSAFPYEEYIQSYPSLEGYLISKFGFGPNWVDFRLACHDSITYGRPVPPQCESLSQIQEAYGIDMREILRDHFAKMKKTANLIVKGRIKRRSQLEVCLSNKSCARVPMLPAGVNPEEISEDSREHLETRRTFWEIVDNGVITPKVCKFIDLCLDLVQMGAINASNPKI